MQTLDNLLNDDINLNMRDSRLQQSNRVADSAMSMFNPAESRDYAKSVSRPDLNWEQFGSNKKQSNGSA